MNQSIQLVYTCMGCDKEKRIGTEECFIKNYSIPQGYEKWSKGGEEFLLCEKCSRRVYELLQTRILPASP